MAKINGPIENMQEKFKETRLVFGLSVTKFAEMLGVTRQTIYNIENGRTKMNTIQYLAMRALISDLLESFPDKKKLMDVLWDRDYEKEDFENIVVKHM